MKTARKQGWTPAQIKDLNGKTFVITGGNAGAGFEASRILLSKGAEVVMLNRSVERSQKAVADLKQQFGNSAKVSYVQLDLASLASVHKGALEVLEKVPQIDALMCNAAVAQLSTQSFTEDGFESHLGINHYGHFLLLNLLFERVEQSKGRIVVVGSEGYKMGLKTIQFDDMNWDKNYHANHTYCHSKLAQIMTAYELQHRTEAAGKNVPVYVCHPGASKTSLIDKDAPFSTRLMWKLLSNSPLVQTAEQGAYPELMCATSNGLNPRAYHGPTGRMQWTGPVGECEVEPFVYDREVAGRLWEVSEAATGSKWAF